MCPFLLAFPLLSSKKEQLYCGETVDRGANRQLPSLPRFLPSFPFYLESKEGAGEGDGRHQLGSADSSNLDMSTESGIHISPSKCVHHKLNIPLLRLCTLSNSLAEEGSLNFGPFVWVSAGAADAAAAAACRVSAAAAPQAEREPRRLSFIGTRGRERERGT